MTRTCAILCVAGLAWAGPAAAQPIQLDDRNSSAVFDPTGGGQFTWLIDGVDHLFNQNFYFRAGAMTDEVDLTSVGLAGMAATDTNPFADGRVDTLALLYRDAGSGLEFEISYSLRGGNAGSNTADIAEQIRISNRGNSSQRVSFFQYVDFDLHGSPGGDVGRIVNGRVAQQSDPAGLRTISETVVTPAPTFFDIALFPTILSLFGNGVADTLSNGNGPVFGDVAWAFQWDFTLGVGQDFIISKDKLIVPTPAGAALLGLGGVMAARRRRS
ncbi:MAG: hypothetical protein C0513_07835 [Isosphaera sp.]|nr:hypothetical protein [Isosphaera sp.]